MVRKRVAIIGLDGASLELIQGWVKDGHLPNLKRLMDEGACGHLRSTIPPFTPTAWTSAVTGKNPGKHGIFGFTSKGEFGGKLHFNSSLDRRADPIWVLLERHGMKSIVLKVPMTYPPDRFNGIMISDVPLSFNRMPLDFKRSSDALIEPRSLKTMLEDEFGSVSQWLDKKKYKGLKRDGMAPAKRLPLFEESSKVFSKIISSLLKRYQWSFFMYVDPITDYFGHKCFPMGRITKGSEDFSTS